MRYALIYRNGDYRVTDRVTDTHLRNHRRHGWTIVKTWTTKPTETTVTAVAFQQHIENQEQPA